MPDAKRSDSKRRSPASRPGRLVRREANRRSRASVARCGRPNRSPLRRPTPSPRRSPRPPRGNLSSAWDSLRARAAILAAVVCALTLTIAGPVRTFFAQRTEMKQLAATEAALRAQIAELEQQKVKLADPVFVAAQARERLGFVMPGEIPTRCSCLPNSLKAAQPLGAACPRRCPVTRGTRRCGAPSPRLRRMCRRRPPPNHRRRHPSPVVELADIEAVARQLGRLPRGVLAISYWCPNGDPGVIKTSPRLPDGTPFPTLYYLTHPLLVAAAGRLESSGLMKEMTARLAADPGLAQRYRSAHESYLASEMRSNLWARRSAAAACPIASSACTC